MGLRLTFDEETKASLTSSVESPQVVKINSTEQQKVFLYGFFSGNEANLSSNPLVAYALTEGYLVENRDINSVGEDLKEAPEAVVINPAAVDFLQLLLGLAFLTPNYPKVLFLFSLSNSSENTRAFWRNFGVLTILNFPISPIELFSLIKLFRKLVGKVAPSLDFSLSVDFDERLASAGKFIDFTLSIKNTLGADFKVSLSFTGSEIGNEITFFPSESLVPFTSICRAFIPTSLLGKRASFFVEARNGELVRVVKLTVTVVP